MNRFKQKKDKLNQDIENNVFSICFGGRKKFNEQYYLKENRYGTHQKWLNNFRKNRDKNIFNNTCDNLKNSIQSSIIRKVGKNNSKIRKDKLWKKINQLFQAEQK